MTPKYDQYLDNKERSERNIRLQINKRIEWFEKENGKKVKEIRFYIGNNCYSVKEIDNYINDIEIITKED